ncbi:hypothetical protein HDU96_011097 [Phlyctochytrium bullatum]|nr:hypothetical protein HDU96_011097 [Phlyctochytrium bullatum]
MEIPTVKLHNIPLFTKGVSTRVFENVLHTLYGVNRAQSDQEKLALWHASLSQSSLYDNDVKTWWFTAAQLSLTDLVSSFHSEFGEPIDAEATAVEEALLNYPPTNDMLDYMKGIQRYWGFLRKLLEDGGRTTQNGEARLKKLLRSIPFNNLRERMMTVHSEMRPSLKKDDPLEIELTEAVLAAGRKYAQVWEGIVDNAAKPTAPNITEFQKIRESQRTLSASLLPLSDKTRDARHRRADDLSVRQVSSEAEPIQAGVLEAIVKMNETMLQMFNRMEEQNRRLEAWATHPHPRPPPQPVTKVCESCKNQFRARFPAHRLCDDCHRRNWSRDGTPHGYRADNNPSGRPQPTTPPTPAPRIAEITTYEEPRPTGDFQEPLRQ